MEKKKNEHADLETKRAIFFEIGLIVSLGMVLTAFQWKSPIKETDQIYSDPGIIYELDFPEMIKKEEVKPVEPEKPRVKLFAIIEQVEDWRDVLDDPNFLGIDDNPDDYFVPFIEVPEDPGEEEIFVSVEEMPKFQGGDLNTFHHFVMKSIIYPEIAIENQVQGIVSIEFVIDKKGNLIDVIASGNADQVLKQEAIRAVNTSPKWTPGYQMDKPVNVKMSIPIVFRLH